MRRLWPIGLLLVFFLFLYKDLFIRGFIPIPADTLVGAYYPWLDYKWGYPVGVPVKNALISDVFSTLFIWKQISTAMLKQGIIPFWNPYSFSGTPLLATFHSTTLSPWNLFFLLPEYWGWGIYIFSSSLFAALAMYFYLSVLIKNRRARLVGAVVFALAGPMTTWTEFGTAVWAAGSLPLIFLGLELVITRHKPRFYFLILAASVLLLLSGHVQLLTYAFVIIPFYALFRSKNPKTTILVVIALLVSVMLTAVQLIPTADFFTRSIRSEEKYSQTFNSGLIPVSQLIRLWIPDFFGHPVTGNSWGPYIYHEYASFLGTLVLPLVLAALFFRRDFSVRFFSWVFLLSIFLVLNQPFSRWFFGLPLPLLTYSSASRLFFITGLSASILAALFLDSPRWRRVILPVLVLIAVSIAAISLVPPAFRNISLRNLVFPVLQLVLLLTLLIFKKFHRFLPLLLIIIISFDLSRYFLKYNPFVPSGLVFPTTPVIDFLKAQTPPFRIARQPTALLPPNTWAMYNLENIEGYDPLYLSGYNRFFHVINGQPYFDSASRYSELTDFQPRFLDALNVKYLITVRPEVGKTLPPFLFRIRQNSYPLVFSDGHTQIYQNPGSLPRAYFVSQILAVSDEAGLAKILDQPTFDPTQTAVLFSSSATATASGAINNYSSRPNSFSFTAKAASSGLLMIANSYDPGWRAFIDNQPSPVYRANGGLMAITVPAGVHRIDFRYSPPFIGLALLLTSLSWLGTTALYLVSVRKIV